MKNAKRSPRPRRPLPTRRPAVRPVLELLEERTLMDAGEWLVRLQGLPGDTTAQQMQAAADLFHASGLQDQDVKVVDHVDKGQKLGLSGETGLAGGDHLHFSMQVDGVQVNPIEWWDEHWIKDRILSKIGGAEQASTDPGPASQPSPVHHKKRHR